MSVGDVKGSRRRFKQREKLGHTPKRSGLSVSESIARNKEIALRQAKVKKK